MKTRFKKPIPHVLLSLLLFAAPVLAADEAPVAKDVSVSEAARLLKENPEAVALDVRTPEEFEDGHIEDAKLIDYTGDDFEAAVSKLDRDKPYVIHCASGVRSSDAMDEMKALGLRQLYHLKAGFKGWKKAGNPVVKE